MNRNKADDWNITQSRLFFALLFLNEYHWKAEEADLIPKSLTINFHYFLRNDK